MPYAYTEKQLVERPAMGLFAELGWQTVSALEETFGATGTLLRDTKGEAVLVSRLRAALERLNLALPPEAITAAVDELTRDMLPPRLLPGQAALPHPTSPKGRGGACISRKGGKVRLRMFTKTGMFTAS